MDDEINNKTLCEKALREDAVRTKSPRKNTDSAEQSVAITAPANKNMIIVAGAGSGKTYTMTRRVIDLIDRGVAPESILGLTFTNKAASELLARVAQAVSQHANVSKQSFGTSASSSNSLSSSNAFLKPEVMTYDAFFQSIVRQYGLLVGFDHNTQPLSDAGARELIKPLVNEYVDKHPEIVKLYKFDALVDDVLALAADISCSMIGLNSRGESLDSTSSAVLKIQKWNNAWIEHLQKALSAAETTTIVAKKPSAVKLRRAKTESDEKYFKKCENYGKEYVEYLNITLKNTCYDSCNKLFEAAKKRAALLDLVLSFDSAKRSANMAQFSDFTIAAYRLVTHFPSIAAQYRRQYSQVLLDEYQDTSTTQAMLIATLFHNARVASEDNRDSSDSSESENSENTSAGNSLAHQQTHIAAVGDPFQAIYSFRGASSGAFRKLQQALNIDQSSEFSLTQTRRNSKLILQAANAITKPLRVPSLRKSSSLASEVEVKNLQYLENAPQGSVSVLNMPTQYQEIEAVVRFVKYVKQNALAQNDNILASGLQARAAVLFRSKTNIAMYEEALQKAGLRTLTVGYSALLEKPEVKDVLALLSAVADHTNTSALMRLLATPRFALSTDDLEALANAATDENVEYVFNALAQAGLVDSKAPRASWAKLVREQQSKGAQTNSVHGGVFIADVLLEAFNSTVFAKNSTKDTLNHLKNKLSSKANAAILRAGKVLDAVERAQSGSLHDVVRTAVEALNIDIDVAVSRALMNDNSSNSTLLNDMHSTLDAIYSLADAYLQEMSDFTQPTLRGFISWIQNIDKIDDQPASVDEPADVVLMTIHQSKGLEWPAVAIVGLSEGAFPSSQGDGLRVKQTNQDGVYFESAYATLEIASKVPVPIRVDADILPRFPHNADLSVSMNPQESLRNMETVEKIDAEIYGSRAQAMLDLAEKFYEREDVPEGAIPVEARQIYDAAMKTGTLPLSQVEERGRALHVDERHLMYVALTRAKFAALLTCSQSSAMTADVNGEDSENGAANAAGSASNTSSSRSKKPSVFWNEVFKEMQESCGSVAEVKVDLDEVGYAVGESASKFAELFSEPSEIPNENNKQLLAWPSASSEYVRNALNKSAEYSEIAEISAIDKAYENDKSDENSLLSRAKALLQDADLMPKIDWYHNTVALKNRADQLSKVENVNVTAVQRRAIFNKNADENNNSFETKEAKRLRSEWMAIIRPIPRTASPASDLGTRFHAWAEQFVNAGCLNKNSTQYDVVENISEKLAKIEKTAQDEKTAQVEKSAEHKLLIWEKRLATSKWAYRRPIAAEQPIVAHVPELGDQIINGKIDAIFAGGLDPEDSSKLYTVVDWKTGRKPTDPQDIALKLGQLDWYRLLLSLMTNAPLEAIDATLYYVNVSDEKQREIHAEAKTKDEILAELHSGTLISLDDDDA
ncbi:ATP-dependent helicase [Gardnerella sp. DNF01141]